MIHRNPNAIELLAAKRIEPKSMQLKKLHFRRLTEKIVRTFEGCACFKHCCAGGKHCELGNRKKAASDEAAFHDGRNQSRFEVWDGLEAQIVSSHSDLLDLNNMDGPLKLDLGSKCECFQIGDTCNI